jgi:hypothetical protein
MRNKLMPYARYLISHWRSLVPNSDSGRKFAPRTTPKRSHLMANVLTTGAWLSAPTKKPSFFARLLRAYAESNQRRADRAVGQYIATHGLQKLSDDAERQISRLLVKTGR